MYCDDTSGNTSKKWNEHNSILFTLAGLPREHVQKEYNIHFLTTSNIAPPLEMMDGVVEQLEYVDGLPAFAHVLTNSALTCRAAQESGIWAWDSETMEPVLIVPFVLALLGDNPMQSEFACHMGMRAKFFCRNCWVKGKDMVDDTEKSTAGPSPSDVGLPEVSSDVDSDHGEDGDLEGSVDAGSDGEGSMGGADSDHDSGSLRPSKKKGKKQESMADMVHRVTAFLKVRTNCT